MPSEPSWPEVRDPNALTKMTSSFDSSELLAQPSSFEKVFCEKTSSSRNPASHCRFFTTNIVGGFFPTDSCTLTVSLELYQALPNWPNRVLHITYRNVTLVHVNFKWERPGEKNLVRNSWTWRAQEVQKETQAKLEVRISHHRTPSLAFQNGSLSKCAGEPLLGRRVEPVVSKPEQITHSPKLAEAKTSKTSCNAVLPRKAVSVVLLFRGHWGVKLPNNSTRCCKCHHRPKLILSFIASAFLPRNSTEIFPDLFSISSRTKKKKKSLSNVKRVWAHIRDASKPNSICSALL